MTTLSQPQIEATARRLEMELADVDRELAALDDRLVNQAGTLQNDPKEAAQLSGRVIALRTRRVSIEAAQKRNEKEMEKLKKLLQSREYQKGKAALAEDEKFFKSLYADIRERVTRMREQLEQADAKRTEYLSLLSKFGLELSEVEKASRRSSDELGYLREILNLLESQKWMDDRRVALQDYRNNVTLNKDAKAAIDKQRAEQAKKSSEYAKSHPLVMPEDKPIPLDPSCISRGV